MAFGNLMESMSGGGGAQQMQGMGGFDPSMMQRLRMIMGGGGQQMEGMGGVAQQSPFGLMMQKAQGQNPRFQGGENPYMDFRGPTAGGFQGPMMQNLQPQGARMDPNLMNRPGMQDPRNRRARGF